MSCSHCALAISASISPAAAGYPNRTERLGKALQFRNSSMRGVDLLVPLTRDLGDYAQRMADLIVALATIEQRPIWEILNDLSAPSGDVFRLKIAGSVTSQGSFPLDEAIKLFQGGRQLLWSSAFGLLRPEALHPHRKDQAGRGLLEDVPIRADASVEASWPRSSHPFRPKFNQLWRTSTPGSFSSNSSHLPAR